MSYLLKINRYLSMVMYVFNISFQELKVGRLFYKFKVSFFFIVYFKIDIDIW